MHAGLITTDASSGQAEGDEKMCQDFESRLYILKAAKGETNRMNEKRRKYEAG